VPGFPVLCCCRREGCDTSLQKQQSPAQEISVGHACRQRSMRPAPRCMVPKAWSDTALLCVWRRQYKGAVWDVKAGEVRFAEGGRAAGVAGRSAVS
jgi:hypothetical protein